MRLLDFLRRPLEPDEFVQQRGIVPACDAVMASPFFCDANLAHFGIESLQRCARAVPDRPAVLMTRFRDGALQNALSQCADRPSQRYILVQTLIGDDGTADAATLASLPENIARVYSKNVTEWHDRLRVMPIGRDWRVTAEGLSATYSRADLNAYRNLLYLNFSIETNPPVRRPLFDALHDEPWVTARCPVAYGKYDLSHGAFVAEMHEHRFTVSPIGRALDCYRTWDALFAKSLPIVYDSAHAVVYADLPVVILDGRESLRRELLEETFSDFLQREFDVERLTAGYWRRLIRSDARELLGLRA